MLTRRQFIQTTARVSAGATVVLLLTPVGCGDDDSGGTVTTTSPTNPAVCNGAFATSTVVLAHTHQVCAPLADLTNPPGAGVVYVTTLADGHTHNVQLSQAQLQNINRGQTVLVTTTTMLGHEHAFSLGLITQPTDPSPPPGGY